MRNSQPETAVCHLRKRDCKSLQCMAISKRQIKMTTINKVPPKPMVKAVLRLATSEPTLLLFCKLQMEIK